MRSTTSWIKEPLLHFLVFVALDCQDIRNKRVNLAGFKIFSGAIK